MKDQTITQFESHKPPKKFEIVKKNIFKNIDFSTGEYISPPLHEINFRKWQDTCYKKLKKHDNRLLQATPGAGKSIEMSALALFDQSQGHNIIIVVPQINIGKGYKQTFINVPGMGIKEFIVGNHYDLTTGTINSSKTEQLTGILKQRTKGKIIKVCNQTLINYFKQEKEKISKQTRKRNIFKHTSIFLDEGHHSQFDDTDITNPEFNSLGEIVDYVLTNKDTKLTLATATFFRTNKRNIIPNKYKNEFVEFLLPFDEHYETMEYLNNIKFSVSLTKKLEKIVKQRTVDYENNNQIFFIPHPNTNMYTDKTAFTTQIIKWISKDFKQDKTDTWKWVNSKNGAVLIDLVEDNHNRKYAMDFIHAHNKDREKFPCIIIALELCQEGSDFPLINKVDIIGERKSCIKLVQMVGRALRDIEGKEEADINLILPIDSTKWKAKDGSLEDSCNEILNTIIATMLLEEIYSTPTKLDTSVGIGGGSSNRLLDIIGDVMTYRDIMDDINKQLVIEEELSREEELDIIQEILIKYDVVESESVDYSVAEALHTSFHKKMIQRVGRMSPGYDLKNLDFKLLKDKGLQELVKSFCCDIIGVKEFGMFRGRLLGLRRNDDFGMLEKVAEYYHSNGYYARATSDDIEEKTMGMWRERIKHCKHRQTYRLKKHAIKLNISDVFSAHEQELLDLEMAQYVYEYKKKHGGYPSGAKTQDQYTKKLANWIYSMRNPKNISRRTPKLIKKCNQLKMIDIFKKIKAENQEIEDLLQIDEIYAHYNKTRKYPSTKSKTDEIRKLGYFINSFKRTPKRITENILDKLKEKNMLDMLNIKDKKESNLDNLYKCVKYKKEHGRYPPDGHILQNWRRHIIKTNNIPDYLKKEVAKQGKKFSDFFMSSTHKTLESDDINMQLCIEYKKKHGVYPPQRTKLGTWLSNIRSPRDTKRRTRLESVLRESKITQFDDMFIKPFTLTYEKDIIKLKYCKKYKKKHGVYPPVDKTTIGNWLTVMRGREDASIQSRRQILLPLLKELGIPDIFKKVRK